MFPWLSVAPASAPPSSFGEVLDDTVRLTFPAVRADNLLGEDREYPAWYVGRTSLVFVVWAREQQRVADTWLGCLDGWMCAGIPSPEGRERTVTLYTGGRRFGDASTLRGMREATP